MPILGGPLYSRLVGLNGIRTTRRAKLGLLVACSILACCQDGARSGGDAAADGGGSTDGITRIYGTVWGNNQACCEQSGSVDPMHLELNRLTNTCTGPSPADPVEGCDGDFDSGASYECVLDAGGCFRFTATDSSGFYGIDTVFDVSGGESYQYDVNPVCLCW